MCDCCSQELATKRGSILNHISSKKHQNNLQALNDRTASTGRITEHLEQVDEEMQFEGSSLPIATRTFRVFIASTLMCAGIALEKLSDGVSNFRACLEYQRGSLPVDSIRQQVPVVQEMEDRLIKRELQRVEDATGYPPLLSVVFDGTTRICEVFALVIRYVDEKLNIQQRLVSLSFLQKSLTGAQTAAQIVHELFEYLKQPMDQVVCAMRDGASVNTLAIATLLALCPLLIDITCFSHAVNNCGKLFNTPILDVFVSDWASMMATSAAARVCWYDLTESQARRKSATRW
jgi:hypothetical protein